MRRLVVLVTLLALFMIATPVAASDTHGPYIPWNEDEGFEIYVAPGDTVLLGARFGTCTRGLTVAFSKASTLEMSIELEGAGAGPQPVAITGDWTDPEVPDESIVGADTSNCKSSAHQEFFWWTFWEQSIQFNEIGVYYVHLTLGSSHQLTDGWAIDQYGPPLRYGPGTIADGVLVVNVENP